jgi:short subunit dehydrogenase-like uncharacterized protein
MPDLDLVLHGATGFIGRLAADHLAHHAPRGLRWALAGRDADRLDRLVRSLAGQPAAPAAAIVAGFDRPETLRRMAERTAVVVSCAGPFDALGPALVDACVDAGADYADIAPEPRFVERLIGRLHGRAEARGRRVLPACGFQSLPFDLGVRHTIEALPEGVPLKVEGFLRCRANVTGGLWHAAVKAFRAERHRVGGGGRPTGRRVRAIRPHARWEREIRGWACPLPTLDPSIVLRSARLDARYGPDFRYGHYIRIHRLPTLVGSVVGTGTLFTLAQARPTRELLLRVREPGMGPTEEQRERGWFRITFVGRGGGRVAVTEATGGDPTSEETARMIAEVGLALVARDARLTDRRGVLTPATALTSVMRERLNGIGLGFRVIRKGRRRGAFGRR